MLLLNFNELGVIGHKKMTTEGRLYDDLKTTFRRPDDDFQTTFGRLFDDLLTTADPPPLDLPVTGSPYNAYSLLEGLRFAP